jgi:hypothetical protein
VLTFTAADVSKAAGASAAAAEMAAETIERCYEDRTTAAKTERFSENKSISRAELSIFRQYNKDISGHFLHNGCHRNNKCQIIGF